jgi:hypothetical protein
MFLAVLLRARTVAGLILIAAVASSAAAAATARRTSRPPSPARIRAAVRAAERSRSLWATVNICDTARHPDTIGVRGQMPGLGFPADLSMGVQIDYWSFRKNKFVTDPGVTKKVTLGSASDRLVQGGANFRFTPPVVLSGTVTFEWKLAGKVIGRATRLTGHDRHVDGGDPPGYSAPDCTMH